MIEDVLVKVQTKVGAALVMWFPTSREILSGNASEVNKCTRWLVTVIDERLLGLSVVPALRRGGCECLWDCLW